MSNGQNIYHGEIFITPSFLFMGAKVHPNNKIDGVLFSVLVPECPSVNRGKRHDFDVLPIVIDVMILIVCSTSLKHFIGFNSY